MSYWAPRVLGAIAGTIFGLYVAVYQPMMENVAKRGCPWRVCDGIEK